MDRTQSKVIALPTPTEEAHDATPTCRAARGAHWTAHTLACRSRRDLVNVQRAAKAVR